MVCSSLSFWESEESNQLNGTGLRLDIWYISLLRTLNSFNKKLKTLLFRKAEVFMHIKDGLLNESNFMHINIRVL